MSPAWRGSSSQASLSATSILGQRAPPTEHVPVLSLPVFTVAWGRALTPRTKERESAAVPAPSHADLWEVEADGKKHDGKDGFGEVLVPVSFPLGVPEE